eukprot:PITA_34418
MNKILPTWRNRRIGEATLARKLDRFIMKGTMFQQLHLYKQWVGSGGISDHYPIYLELSGPTKKPKAPFKFNHGWLQDPSYIKPVKEYWTQNPIDQADSLSKGFCMNLSQLKHMGLGFITTADKVHLVELETKKQKILREREETIRLRSRATWLKAGDENTRFFHNYAKGRKVKNTIWSLPTPDGDVADTYPKLSQMGSSHFRNLYKQRQGTSIAEIINIAGHFPIFVNEDEADHLFDPVSPEELEITIKWFKKDRSPGPDGWKIEFYIAFYDLISNDLLRVIEECRVTGTMYNAINSTFIALIPKSDSPSSFDDYRPISLCNVLYNIISKIIANRIRPILSRHIAPHQFAFLEHRQIHEAVGAAQEALHSIWTKHLKEIILKIDLAKAFDRVSWIYLKMILIHLGFPQNFISWIMACITTPTFSVLINGSTSQFFHLERGLRQGFPLSPLLFLIVMDALSRLIDSTKRNGDFNDLRITDECSLTHLLFVDDVMIFLDGSIRDSRTSIHESLLAQQCFPYSIHPLDHGLKYLGFRLKPVSSKITEWIWLVAKLEKLLNIWSHRYLSREGRLVLVKVVLEATPVYWMALAWIPRSILARLQQICNRYLWNGNQEKRIFAWVGWKNIATPKKWGGWGLKDLPSFAQALAAKMGWTLLTGNNLWTCISYHKYIWPHNILDWVRLPTWPKTGIYYVWKALLNSLPLIRDNLVWRVNDGSLARIGMDPWPGCGGRHILPDDLIQHLHSQAIRVMVDIADPQKSSIFDQCWKSTHQINLPPVWHQDWMDYITALSEAHIRIKQGPDELMWHLSGNGIYSPKSGYLALISHKILDAISFWWQTVWKLTAPPRQKLFFWCILKGVVPTGDYLMHRAVHGPTWCTFCKETSESCIHLFLLCPAISAIWQAISFSILFTGKWEGHNINRAWESWFHNYKLSKLQSLPAITCRYIWLARNRMIFDDKLPNWPHIISLITAAYNSLPDPPQTRNISPCDPPAIDHSTPWAFFDGSAQQQGCGGGFLLYNFAEIISLRHLLHFALGHNCLHIHIFGDSKIIIDWFNNTKECHTHTLRNILEEINILKAQFIDISCQHIYREHNSNTDKLSKEATSLPRGEWLIQEQRGADYYQYYHRPYNDAHYHRAVSP